MSIDSSKTDVPVKASGGRLAKRGLVLVLVILVVVILLAETGVIVAESTETTTQAEMRYEFNATISGRRDSSTVLRGANFVPIVSSGGTGDRALANDVANLLRQSATGRPASPGTQLDVSITSVTSNSTDWLPFYKSGSCRFNVGFTITAKNAVVDFKATGTVAGTVEQTMSGLCSRGLFREKMARAIADSVNREVNKAIAKHS